MDASLRTWQLIPTGIPSALWSLSTLVDFAYIRAVGPTEARVLAAHHFRKYPVKARDPEQLPSPYLDPDLVACLEIMDERFRTFDRTRVLTEVQASELLPHHSTPSEEQSPSPVSPREQSLRTPSWSTEAVAATS
jgi:hypothetical protein